MRAAAHFALAVTYKAWVQPYQGVVAAINAMTRCQELSETWADATELVGGPPANHCDRITLRSASTATTTVIPLVPLLPPVR